MGDWIEARRSQQAAARVEDLERQIDAALTLIEAQRVQLANALKLIEAQQRDLDDTRADFRSACLTIAEYERTTLRG